SPNELWGIRVLLTTQQLVGNGLLIDSSKFGYVAVRESLSMRVGYDGNDFSHNILRTLAEERLTLCVTRSSGAGPPGGATGDGLAAAGLGLGQPVRNAGVAARSPFFAAKAELQLD